MTVETSIQYTVYLSAQNWNANLQFSYYGSDQSTPL